MFHNKLQRRSILWGIMASVMIPSVAFGEYTLRPLSEVLDFGVIKEEAGPSTKRILLLNEGPDDTYIREVRPSCGCTGADFKKGNIAPGDTAWVSVTYNPKGRPGPFDKTVRIITGDDSERQVVKIQGTVIGTPETLQANYPYEMGALRVSDTILDMGTVADGASRHKFVNAYNQSSDTLRIELKSSSPILEAALYPLAIGPGDVATFSFYLTTRNLPADSIGQKSYTTTIYTVGNEGRKEIGEIETRAKIIRQSEGLTSEGISNSPRLAIRKNIIALEGIKPGSRRDFSIMLENDGGSTLRIINILCNDSSIEIGEIPEEIKSGSRAAIKCRYKKPKKTRGAVRIPIEIYSSDPLHPLQTLFVTSD